MISNELKSQIQGAYSRFLEAKSLKPRYGQRLRIAEVAKVLGDIDTDEEGHRSGDPAVVGGAAFCRSWQPMHEITSPGAPTSQERICCMALPFSSKTFRLI